MPTVIASKISAVVAPEVATIIEVRTSVCATGTGCTARVVEVVVSVVELGKLAGV